MAAVSSCVGLPKKNPPEGGREERMERRGAGAAAMTPFRTVWTPRAKEDARISAASSKGERTSERASTKGPQEPSASGEEAWDSTHDFRRSTLAEAVTMARPAAPEEEARRDAASHEALDDVLKASKGERRQ